MLLVKTRLAPSPIAGIGLFAGEDIARGTITWRFMPGYDRMLTAREMSALPEPARSALLDHVYLDAESGLFVLCMDNARFMNHADDPNTKGIHDDGKIEGYDVATRDIAEGEELTCDYNAFDANVTLKLGR
jgi:SET domain-containing protein